MTIDQAIERLTKLANENVGIWLDYELEAAQLGIEALKRCKYIRTHPSEPRVWKLPGETV